MLELNDNLNNQKWDRFSPNETKVIKLGMLKFRDLYEEIASESPISTVVILDSSGRVFSSAINLIMTKISQNKEIKKPSLRFFATRRTPNLIMVQDREADIFEFHERIKKMSPNYEVCSLEEVEERAFEKVTKNDNDFANQKLLKMEEFLNFEKEDFQDALEKVIKEADKFSKNKIDGDDYEGIDFERSPEVYANILKQAIELAPNSTNPQERIQKLEKRYEGVAADRGSDILFVIMNLIEKNKLTNQLKLNFEDILKLVNKYIQELKNELNDIKNFGYSKSVFESKNLRKAMEQRAKQILEEVKEKNKDGIILIFDEYLSTGSSFKELLRAVHLQG